MLCSLPLRIICVLIYTNLGVCIVGISFDQLVYETCFFWWSVGKFFFPLFIPRFIPVGLLKSIWRACYFFIDSSVAWGCRVGDRLGLSWSYVTAIVTKDYFCPECIVFIPFNFWVSRLGGARPWCFLPLGSPVVVLRLVFSPSCFPWPAGPAAFALSLRIHRLSSLLSRGGG